MRVKVLRLRMLQGIQPVPSNPDCRQKDMEGEIEWSEGQLRANNLSLP